MMGLSGRSVADWRRAGARRRTPLATRQDERRSDDLRRLLGGRGWRNGRLGERGRRGAELGHLHRLERLDGGWMRWLSGRLIGAILEGPQPPPRLRTGADVSSSADSAGGTSAGGTSTPCSGSASIGTKPAPPPRSRAPSSRAWPRVARPRANFAAAAAGCAAARGGARRRRCDGRRRWCWWQDWPHMLDAWACPALRNCSHKNTSETCPFRAQLTHPFSTA